MVDINRIWKYNKIMKTVAQKMGIKNNIRAFFVNAPIGIFDFMELPDIEIINELNGDFDYIHFFVKEQTILKEQFPILKKHVKSNGMLWISWPKAGQLGTDLNLKKIINIGYNFGLVESTTLSINDIWSGIKFTNPKKGKIYKNSYGKLKLENNE
jgi:hypothetical protein